MDGLLREVDDTGYDRNLDQEWVRFLDRWYSSLRFPVHGLQMLAAYLAQMAPASRITNCAAFQAADELRRVQRIAYRTVQLGGPPGETEAAQRQRAAWEDAAAFQPLRELIERALVAYDWGEAFTVIADRLAAVLEAGGRDAVAVYLGNPSAHGLSPLIYGRVFIKALGTRNVFSASTVDQWPKQLASGLLFGYSYETRNTLFVISTVLLLLTGLAVIVSGDNRRLERAAYIALALVVVLGGGALLQGEMRPLADLL